jgi:hypothetical protein
LSSSMVFYALGSNVVTTHPAIEIRVPKISAFVTGIITAILHPTIIIAHKLEYRFAWDIIV